MPERFSIRDATKIDVPEIAAIYGYEVENGIATFEEVPPLVAEMIERMKDVQALDLPYLVAFREGAILGYAYAAPYKARSAYRYSVEDTVYLHPHARRQGVGRALVSTLIARCEASGARQMLAGITHYPGCPSAGLHAALGFRMVGISQSVGYKFGRWLDVAYMQRALGAGDTSPPDWAAAGRRE
jgi:phosphinothricin acetyltransferase